ARSALATQQPEAAMATVNGTGGDDFLTTPQTTPGDDLINGRGGNDVIQGLAGNDTIRGEAGFDAAVYFDATGNVAADLVAGTASGAGVGTDTLIAIEVLIGSAFDDALRGDAKGNRLVGFLGDDLLDGRGGRDNLDGGDGRDLLLGRSGNDSLFGGGGDDVLKGGGGADTLVGDEIIDAPGND